MTELEFNDEIMWFSYGLKLFSEKVLASDEKSFLSGELQDNAKEILFALADKRPELETILFPLNGSQPVTASPRVRDFFDSMSSVEEALQERPRFAEVKVHDSGADSSGLVPYPTELLRDSLCWWTTNLSARFQDLKKGPKEPISGAYTPGADNESTEGEKLAKIDKDRREEYFLEQTAFKKEIGIDGIMSEPFFLNTDHDFNRTDLAVFLADNGIIKGKETKTGKTRFDWSATEGLFFDEKGVITPKQFADLYNKAK